MSLTIPVCKTSIWEKMQGLKVQSSCRCGAGAICLAARQKVWKSKATELSLSAAPLSFTLPATQRKFRRPGYVLVLSNLVGQWREHSNNPTQISSCVIYFKSQSSVKHKSIGKQIPSVLWSMERDISYEESKHNFYFYCKLTDKSRSWTQQCQQALL